MNIDIAMGATGSHVTIVVGGPGTYPSSAANHSAARVAIQRGAYVFFAADLDSSRHGTVTVNADSSGHIDATLEAQPGIPSNEVFEDTIAITGTVRLKGDWTCGTIDTKSPTP